MTAMQVAATVTVTVAVGWLVPEAVRATGSEWVVAVGALALVAGVVLPVRLPELLLIAILGATLLLNDELAFSIGLPSIGINIVDIVVLCLLPWALARALAAARAGRLKDPVWLLILLVLAVGTLFLGVGVARGAPLRTALRDYRLFVYLPITYAYTAQVCANARRCHALLIAWYGIAALQFVLVGTGLLVLHWDVGKPLVAFPSYPGTSIWHFIGVWSYLPLFVSLAYLLRPSRLSKLEVGLHGSVVVILTLIAALSLSRGLWIVVAAAGLFTAAMTRGRRLASSFRLVLIASVVSTLVVAFLASRASESLAALTARVASIDAQNDLAVIGRVADISWTLGEIARNPLGYGLGMGDVAGFGFVSGGEQLGGAMHMGYVWMAYRCGVLAPILFIVALWLALRRARRAINTMDSRFDPRPAWLCGVAATLFALAMSALSGTTMAYFMATPYFGLLLGLLTQAAAPPPGRRVRQATMSSGHAPLHVP